MQACLHVWKIVCFVVWGGVGWRLEGFVGIRRRAKFMAWFERSLSVADRTCEFDELRWTCLNIGICVYDSWVGSWQWWKWTGYSWVLWNQNVSHSGGFVLVRKYWTFRKDRWPLRYRRKGLSILVKIGFSKTDFRIELPLTTKELFDVKCDNNGLVITMEVPR